MTLCGKNIDLCKIKKYIFADHNNLIPKTMKK